MIVKTSELTGAALDWAVAKCEPNMLDLYYSDDNEPLILEEAPDYHQVWEPSTNWLQGGPIIERERIELLPMFNPEYWSARVAIGGRWCEGDTSLITAMRCFVSSKLGDKVEVPDELFS